MRNVFPAAPAFKTTDYLCPCRPYLARRKSDGELRTVIRADEAILYVSEDDLTMSSVDYFFRAYEVIRPFVKGEDTVTIGAW